MDRDVSMDWEFAGRWLENVETEISELKILKDYITRRFFEGWSIENLFYGNGVVKDGGRHATEAAGYIDLTAGRYGIGLGVEYEVKEWRIDKGYKIRMPYDDNVRRLAEIKKMKAGEGILLDGPNPGRDYDITVLERIRTMLTREILELRDVSSRARRIGIRPGKPGNRSRTFLIWQGESIPMHDGRCVTDMSRWLLEDFIARGAGTRSVK